MRILYHGIRLSIRKIPPLRSSIPFVRQMTMLVLLAAAMLVAAKTFSQTVPANITITFSGKRVPLKQVFNEIEKQTSYDVLYNPEQIDSSATVTVNAKNQPLEEFLKTFLTKQSLGYSFINTTIAIYRMDGSTNFTTTTPKKPNIVGAVYDEKSSTPLAGVSVLLIRAGKGTQTDNKGEFTLKEVNEDDSIRFTIIGYEPVILRLKNTGNALTIMMKIATSDLDAAVIKAFGVTSNRLATGSITRISGEEIRRQPVMNPLLALQGRVPGMVITPTSGFANSPVKVEIRGRNTLNETFSGEPLYVIDGVPRVILDVSNVVRSGSAPSSGPVQGGLSFTGGQSILFGMNPNDIESIEVLRDGDATALYGTRAANGVVLITTKKAKAGKTSFGINIDQGVSVISRNVSMMNTAQYLQMRREAFKNDGITPTPENAPDLMLWDTTRYTNWQKELLRVGKNLSVGAQLSGGDVLNSIRLSAGYTRQTAMTQRSGKNEVLAISAGLSHKSFNQKLKIDLNIGYNWSNVDAIENGGNYTMPPNAPPIFNEKEELNYAEWNAGNPILNSYPWASILQPNITKTNALNSSLTVGYEIMKGLEFNTQLAYSNTQNTNDVFSTIASQNPAQARSGFAIFSNTKATNWSAKSVLDYSTWIGRGRLAVTTGVSYESQATSAVTTTAIGYDNDELLGSITNAQLTQTTDSKGQYRIASLFGTINYNWENKYILNLNARRDGSSRFAPDSQFGNFGSVGASWILSEENWMKKIMPSWLSFVKFRTSYALTGNDAIGDYQFLSLWGGTISNGQPRYQYNGIRAFVPLNPVNQQYHWEAKKSWEGAIRLGFLENRISAELITYRNIVDDALVSDYPTPVYSGFSKVITNSKAKIENKGVEFVFNATLIQQKNFSWSLGFNVGANKNKLLAYPGLESSPYARLYKVGYSTTSQFLLHYIGVDPLTGLYSFEDYNKDGAIFIDLSKNPGSDGDDRYVVLDMNPKYDGGFSTDFTIYRNFSINLQFAFRKGLVKDLFASTIVGSMSNLFMPEELLNNHWRKPGDNAKYPRFSTQLPVRLNYSDGEYTDASYLRLQNIQFAWQLPEKLIQKAALKSCAFSVSVNNIFVISRYKGADPTLGTLTTPPTPRIINGKLLFMF